MGTPNQDEAYEKVLTALLGRVLDMLRFAEAKNGALLAFASAWIVGIVNLLSSDKALPPGYHNVCLGALPLFILAAVAAIAALLPKLSTSTFTKYPKDHVQNLLFFGDVADLSSDEFKNSVRAAYCPSGDDTLTALYLSDLEEQISINSKITQRKHRIFNIGAIAALAAITALLIPTLGLGLSALKGWIGQ